MVDDPCWETHTPTHGTLQQVWSREVLNQCDRCLDMLTRSSVDGTGCGDGQPITQFVDGS
ncbi:hypothetical protein Hlac_3422 (plasmid) [Halorubrum lacusprofundi ATCC 49239]|uniref:Uncharacterized protein n=1 Tax=Halorubrum lacusprofundi (strain ATCC 49239 / DSM 5036 / JCM 8891 / ACAM 34) TaxID=416348 RepID=B9LWU3_HALLT|nr:hypothetical protein [Halorubrum lacusprofundi]ACM58934.1 hypothetical protein Hlac_3422 [Halorubrum lacusprofundi ATCC 49239]